MSFSSCGILNQWTALSLTTSALSVIIAVISVPINGILILAVISKKRFHHKFYYIMLNTVIADFLQGVIVAPLSADLHRREAVYGRSSAKNRNSRVSLQHYRFRRNIDFKHGTSQFRPDVFACSSSELQSIFS